MKLFAASLLCAILLTGCVRREYIVLHGWPQDALPAIQIDRDCDPTVVPFPNTTLYGCDCSDANTTADTADGCWAVCHGFVPGTSLRWKDAITLNSTSRLW